tara:strand:- start:300 stop:512 length:213 start_codon:yes stop_codon:yes gene_type:complete
MVWLHWTVRPALLGLQTLQKSPKTPNAANANGANDAKYANGANAIEMSRTNALKEAMRSNEPFKRFKWFF